MTDEHQEIEDSECQMLDDELAEQVEQTEAAEQIERAEQVESEEFAEEIPQAEPEEPADEIEQTEPVEEAEQEERAEPLTQAEEAQETEPMAEGEQAEPEQQDQDAELTVESVVEAVLFASDEPLSAARLANIVEADTKQVRKHIENLNEKYKTNGNAFRIEQIASGWQMLTLSPYNHWLKKLLRVRSDNKLSAAAMETLAIIAYKQPVIRADIEVIRGVAAGEMIRSLAYKGLVKIVGRAEVLGRPMLYGTTKKFLEIFGLNTLKDLPKIEELKKPPA
jgi:segregation and condensation protein B